jgi:hypothetical protein
MFKASLAPLLAVLTLMLPVTALAGGTVTKILRPQVHVFDSRGQPAGTLDANAVKMPAPIVARGVDGSVGIRHDGKVVFLRSLDVEGTGASTVSPGDRTGAP